MKKNELKKEFEKEFNNITVSDELKSKTLDAINKIYIKKPSRLPYLKNFAAIFVVTMLCISIYFTKNYPKDNFISDTQKEESASDLSSAKRAYMEKEIQNSEAKSSGTSVPLAPTNKVEKHNLGSSIINSAEDYSINSAQSFVPEASILRAQNTDMIMPDSLLDTDAGESVTLEEEFLKIYPDAEKLENGYRIYKDGKETLYIFENGILKNTIIIE